MSQTCVRLCQIELTGFKNTRYGLVQMPLAFEQSFFTGKADILGIYGQNGSGKTALVEAMGFIQLLLTGKPLSGDSIHYISEEAKGFTISVKFTIEASHKKTLASYCVRLERSGEGEFEIARETLEAALWNGRKFEPKKVFLDYAPALKGILFTPKYRYEELIRSGGENKVNLSVAKNIARREHGSFLFGTEGRAVFLSASESASAEYAYILKALHEYAGMNLFVISGHPAGAVRTDLFLPSSLRLNLGGSFAKGELVRLDEPSVIRRESLPIVQKRIGEMNIVLCAIIPGLLIGIHDFGGQLLENGAKGERIQLISMREAYVIPLKYESEGIIKIISILNVLLCVYNSPSICLIMDELDAGIYEYLLGELLSIFKKGAKGQLVFTSHNLRPLEMLDKKNIVFSTTNPSNRYIRLQNAKSDLNLRDLYLRSITLGGQNEEVYRETDSVEIARALRRAGKVMGDDSKY